MRDVRCEGVRGLTHKCETVLELREISSMKIIFISWVAALLFSLGNFFMHVKLFMRLKCVLNSDLKFYETFFLINHMPVFSDWYCWSTCH